MAFCNSCGASLTTGSRFCSKCGATVLASSPVSAAAPGSAAGSAPPVVPPPAISVPAPRSGGSALKVILIVVGVVVLVGTLCVATLGLLAWRVARHTHVRQEGDNVRVETPFGTVQSTKDPQEAARTLGVDIYPGAEPLAEGATSTTFGTVHTASLNFETTDTLDKVSSFYKSRFPNAMVMTSQADQCTIVSNDKKNMVTIDIKSEGGKTRIAITNVSHKSDATSPN